MNMTAPKLGLFVILLFLNVLFSLSGVLIKFASMYWQRNGFFATTTLVPLCGVFALLAVYAYCWQRVLARVDLTVAYMSKAMVVFWGLLWAYLFFGEAITTANLIGAVIIFIGIFMVATDE